MPKKQNMAIYKAKVIHSFMLLHNIYMLYLYTTKVENITNKKDEKNKSL